MAPVVGIDLGTTNSVIAAVRSGKPFVLPNAEGGRITPSVVSFAADGTYVAGEPARRRAVMFPDATVFSIKRLMGRAFADPNVQSDRRNLPYRVVEGAGGAAWVEVHGRRYSPPEISAIILQKLILDGEAYLGEPIREAVITIPAYFNEKQLQATKDAGMIAGLNVMRVVNEPTAAALAYGLERQADERVLVFSLGGGSMDVSALELGRGVFEVKATMGDTHLGGDDLDWHIVAWLCTEFRTRTGIDLAQNAAAFERLKAAAELAKIDLSSAREAEINLPYIAADANGPHHIHTTLTRQQFNELIAPLLIRIEPPLKQVIGQAWGAYNAADILDDIVLVGGQTRTPAIGDTVQRVLNKVPRRGVDPDEAVALGAAIQAGVMSGAFRDTLLLDVFPFNLCVETASVGDDRSERPPLPLPATPATEPRQPSPAGAPWQYRLLEPLIQPADLARQSTTFTTSRLFTTDQDQQTTAVIQLWYEEEGQSAVPLGRLMLEGMAPEPRGRARIAVQLDIDLDRTVTMTVRDTANPHMQPLTVRSVIPLIQNGGNSHELATAQLTHLSIETAALGTYGERPPLPLPATPAADPSSPLPGGVPRQYRLLEQIVAANTTVPTQKSDVFTTDQDQQTTAIIRLVRFRAPMGDDGVTLGQVMLEGMAPEPRGRARIAVQLDIDANRTITMTVRDRANDREQRLTVHTPSAWGPEDMGRLAAEADARAQRARAVRREQETRDAAVGEASAAEKLLREPSIGLSTEARARIERLAGEIRAAGTQVDLAEIEGQRRALREALYAVADESFRPIQAFGTSLFVSHSHGDNEYCREFVRALREAQANVWYDEDDLPSGELTPKIEAELIARPIFIPMLSPAALQSTWVLKEARRFHELYTRDTRRIIIPVLAAALGGETEIWDFLRDFKRIDGGHLRPYPARDAAHFTLQALTQAAR